MNDVRFALRSLRRSPVFSITSILTLALGVALVTAAFSLVDAVLIQPLPFKGIDQIISLDQRDAQGNSGGVSYPNFLDWQREAKNGSIAAMAYARGRGTSLHVGARAESALTAFVSPGFLTILQSTPVLGRTFRPDEETNGEHVVVLTYAGWRDLFASDPGAIGQSVTLGDGVFTIVGVLPRGAAVPEWAQLFVPLATTIGNPADQVLNARDFRGDSRTIARLSAGATPARAAKELSAIAARLSGAYPAENSKWPAVTVTSLRAQLLGAAPGSVTMLAVAMGLVLLIGWVNVTNLALVRATSRLQEMAIRTSLGASRWRIARQLFTEQLLLAVVALVIGAVASTWVLGLIRGFGAGAPGSGLIAINVRALAFAVVVGALSSVVVGAFPAARIARSNLAAPLKAGSSGAGTDRRQQRLRSVLVIAEIGLALMLVTAAGLVVKSFWRLSHVDPGFNTHGLAVIDISPPGKAYAEPSQAAAFYTRVLESVRNIPGAKSVALSNHLPLNGASLTTTVEIPGRVVDNANDPQVLFRTLSPEYLGTMEIPLKRGRNFAAADLAGGTAVMINETFARTFWPGVDPVGRSVMLHKSAQGFPDYGEPLPGTVVGVIGDVHHYGVNAAAVAEVYVPYTRNPWSHMVVIARSTGDAAQLIPSMRRALLSVDGNINVTGGVFGGFEIVDNIRDGGVSSARFNMMLLAGFSCCALLLSAVGIYGLMAYAVAQRSREMGIRMALGARGGDVFRLMIGSGARLIAGGVVAGLIGAIMLSRLVAGLLFGVTATDPATFATTTALLASVALIACYLPARRASRVDPVVALRQG